MKVKTSISIDEYKIGIIKKLGRGNVSKGISLLYDFDKQHLTFIEYVDNLLRTSSEHEISIKFQIEMIIRELDLLKERGYL